MTHQECEEAVIMDTANINRLGKVHIPDFSETVALFDEGRWIVTTGASNYLGGSAFITATPIVEAMWKGEGANMVQTMLYEVAKIGWRVEDRQDGSMRVYQQWRGEGCE